MIDKPTLDNAQAMSNKHTINKSWNALSASDIPFG